jgi:hypothetical protein
VKFFTEMISGHRLLLTYSRVVVSSKRGRLIAGRFQSVPG